MSELQYIIDHYKDKKVYTPEEEKKVFTEYKKHPSKELKQEIAAHNIRLVVKEAAKWSRVSGTIIDENDLFQEGYLGLLRAIDLFDNTLDIKFSTYAVQWIDQRIRRYMLNTKETIRIPVHAGTLKLKYLMLQQKKFHKDGTKYTDEEICEILNLSKDQYKTLQLTLQRDVVSLDVPVGETEHGVESVLMDFIQDETPDPVDILIQSELRERFEYLLKKYLKEKSHWSSARVKREEEILRRRLGLNEFGTIETLEDIAQDYGLSRERIRQLESHFIKYLKRNKRYLEDFL